MFTHLATIIYDDGISETNKSGRMRGKSVPIGSTFFSSTLNWMNGENVLRIALSIDWPWWFNLLFNTSSPLIAIHSRWLTMEHFSISKRNYPIVSIKSTMSLNAFTTQSYFNWIQKIDKFDLLFSFIVNFDDLMETNLYEKVCNWNGFIFAFTTPFAGNRFFFFNFVLFVMNMNDYKHKHTNIHCILFFHFKWAPFPASSFDPVILLPLH